MYAKTLSIYDFKCFGKAEFELQYPGRTGEGVSELANVNLVLGDNGGGKSSVLRALAIAMLAPALQDSGFVPVRLVRRAKPGQEPVDRTLLKVLAVAGAGEPLPPGRTSAELQLLARLETRPKGNLDRLSLDSTPATPITDVLFDEDSPAYFVVGYGATRRVETGDFSESSARRSRGRRYQRIAGLFEDHVTMRPLQAWLPRLRERDTDRADEAIELLNTALPGNIRFTGERDEDEQYLFDFDGAPTPFTSLSDGYKAFVGFVGDLIAHLADVVPDEDTLMSLPGIVLIDEIDLHLHPEWQRQAVPMLAKAFPALQFVLTSHSPLVASTVRRQNVFVTATAEDGTATIRQLEEKVFGRSAEQLLLSSYFGLQSTRPEAFRAEARTLFEQAADGNSEAALAYLDKLAAPAAAAQA